MSVIKVSGNTGGTGIFHLRAPNSSTDRFVTLPDVTGNFVTTGDNGTITAPMLDGAQSGSAPIFGVRAWVNCNQSVIRGSGNVSSVTDNGTGDYTVNFTTAMPNNNYAVVNGFDVSSDNNTRSDQTIDMYDFQTTRVRVLISKASDRLAQDGNYTFVAIIG